ncbi:uncharacterized protein LOC124616242 [Schistocerca americana]|uniref:uncharacterized protein LOC124616242 n=1 Tax=Schistocerca americana TaxID=7009 RepID=UPI001F4F5E54|nr:uncharacterized protein LOC124616242 [Schistocerca americana]
MYLNIKGNIHILLVYNTLDQEIVGTPLKFQHVLQNSDRNNVAVNKLILNVPQNSIVVLDNASYHNVLHEKPPTMHSRKADMAYWLNSQNIQFDQGSIKIELLALIESNKPTKIYTVDKLLAHYGHSVLCLPPYHPEINPIEMVWATVKNWVATKNVPFKLEDVWKLAEEKFFYITVHKWEAVCRHVEDVEETYANQEKLADKLEEMVIEIRASDTDDTSDDYDDDDDFQPFQSEDSE